MRRRLAGAVCVCVALGSTAAVAGARSSASGVRVASAVAAAKVSVRPAGLIAQRDAIGPVSMTVGGIADGTLAVTGFDYLAPGGAEVSDQRLLVFSKPANGWAQVQNPGVYQPASEHSLSGDVAVGDGFVAVPAIYRAYRVLAVSARSQKPPLLNESG
jgi:hypothetical protein